MSSLPLITVRTTTMTPTERLQDPLYYHPFDPSFPSKQMPPPITPPHRVEKRHAKHTPATTIPAFKKQKVGEHHSRDASIPSSDTEFSASLLKSIEPSPGSTISTAPSSISGTDKKIFRHVPSLRYISSPSSTPSPLLKPRTRHLLEAKPAPTCVNICHIFEMWVTIAYQPYCPAGNACTHAHIIDGNLFRFPDDYDEEDDLARYFRHEALSKTELKAGHGRGSARESSQLASPRIHGDFEAFEETAEHHLGGISSVGGKEAKGSADETNTKASGICQECNSPMECNGECWLYEAGSGIGEHSGGGGYDEGYYSEEEGGEEGDMAFGEAEELGDTRCDAGYLPLFP
ncbi:MAG: hypothetical protein MMC33_006196 [Icmadophila ericetorum]|nr:hypothetical protein [Icmadophila ericetorum]